MATVFFKAREKKQRQSSLSIFIAAIIGDTRQLSYVV